MTRKKNNKPIGITPGERIFDFINALFMLLLIFITIYPLYYVIMASFSDPRMILRQEGPIWWVLGEATLSGYEITLENPNILTGFLNTVFYVLVGTTINMTLTLFAAFILTRKYFLPRNLLMKAMIFTMFFSGGLIPLFFVVKNTGIYDTRWAVILPYAISTYNVIIVRTFFNSLPGSLEEAAIIDGANDFDIFAKVVIPLSKPVIAVITRYYAVGLWNSWFPSMVFQRDSSIYTLQMFLREILISNNTAAGESPNELLEASLSKELVKYCTVVVSTVPILFIYPFLQKYFEKGVMIGAVKG